VNIVPAVLRRRIEHRPNLVKIVDNMGWLFIDKVLRMGAGLLVGIWVARYLGPEQFGLLSFSTAFVALFGALAGLGLQSVVVRNIVLDPTCAEETLGTAALLQLAGGLLAYGCVIGGIVWLRPEDTVPTMLVAILGSILLFKFSDIAVYWFESQVSSKYIAWIQNACFLVFAAIKIGLITTDASLLAFAWVAAGEALVVAILILTMLNMRGPRLLRLRSSINRAKKLLFDSWPLLLSGAAIMVYMKIDQIMLGQMLNDNAVGVYSAAVRISEVWYFIPMVIVASVFPAILEAKKRDELQYQQRLQRLYDLMVALSVFVALPMTFLSNHIVTGLFGSEYTQAGPILAIHIWASVFVFLGVASSQYFIAENRQILSLQRTLVGAVFNIGLNLLLIPTHGPMGASIATVISYAMADFFSDLLQKETRFMFAMKIKSINFLSSSQRLLEKL
jgi:O-antigen/teichoic acid export membrane protein